MLKFTSKEKFIPTWNENEKQENPIELELGSLNMSDYYTLLDISNNVYEEAKSEEEKATVDLKKLSEHIFVLKDIYSKNVKIKANLLLDDKLMTVDQIMDSNVFTGLVMEILYTLINISIVNKGIKKK